jgi:tripartite-type tricarboxylate transporter receptor subunit TctC
MTKKTGPGFAAAGLLIATSVAALAAGTALAQDWEPEFVYAVLQPLPDGFPDGPITVVAAGEEGSVPALLAQRLSEYSQTNTPVKINVEYRPDLAKYGSWEALKYAAGAEGGSDGYLNVIFESPDDLITLHTAPVTKEIGVGLDDLSEVVSLESHRYAVVQCPNASWEPTWDALVQQIKDHPGEVRYAGGEPGDRLDMVFATYMDNLGLGSLYDTRVINFSNTGDVAARTEAVVNCDSDVTVTDLDQLITQKMGEKLSVILIAGGKKLGKYKDVPTAVDVGFADEPMSRTMQVVVPASVDPLRVRWLNALWTKVGKDSYFKAGRVLDQPVNLSTVIDNEASAAMNDASDATMAKVTEELGIKVE